MDLTSLRPRAASSTRPESVVRVALVGALVAGVETNYKNIYRVATDQPGLTPIPVPVRPYRDDALERWFRFFLPSSVRGTIRSIADTAPLFTRARFDAVWTQIDLPLLPWMFTWNALRRVPIIYTADSTPLQARKFNGLYGDWAISSPIKQRVRDILHGICLRRCTAVTALTEWAASSMRDDYGVDPARLHIIPPGVDTSVWSPPPSRRVGKRPVRILFVGRDFHRKGGDLLLDVYRKHLKQLAEVDFVTRSGAVTREAGVDVYDDLAPNDPKLIQLYRNADLFVLPTRADCFSIAGLEAMATGLPVITCPVGGVGELFEDGVQGVFVPPDDPDSLMRAVTSLVSDEQRRRAMGDAARALAVSRYDIEANTLKLFRLLDSASAG